jgi:hypothetical protein
VLAALRRLWHTTIGKAVAAVLAAFAAYAVLTAVQRAAAQEVSNAAAATAASKTAARPTVSALQRAGLLPSSLSEVQLQQAEAQLGLASPSGGAGIFASTTSARAPALPPPIPAPGTGALHVVSQQLTRGVAVVSDGSDVFSFGPLTVAESPSGSAYSLDTAITLAESSGVSASLCGAALAGGQPWRLTYPPTVPQYHGYITYPGDAGFLDALQADGYLDPTTIHLGGAPAASWPTNLYTQQPNFGEVFGSQAPADLSETLVPGTLYINLELTSSPGQPYWTVSEWNYAFAPSGTTIITTCHPQKTPPPAHAHPAPQKCVEGQSCTAPGSYCPANLPPTGVLDTCCPPGYASGNDGEGCVLPSVLQQENSPCPPDYVWKIGQPNPKCVGAVLVPYGTPIAPPSEAGGGMSVTGQCSPYYRSLGEC